MMKRIGLLLVGILALLMVGCGPQHSPENTVKAYYNALLEQNFDNAAQYLYLEDLPKTNLVSQMLSEAYQKDNRVVSFSVLGSARTTNDAAQVAIAYEIAKAPKGGDAKNVILLDLVKIDGKWYITF